jgi:nucleotide-binding universal stress UspA family protein
MVRTGDPAPTQEAFASVWSGLSALTSPRRAFTLERESEEVTMFEPASLSAPVVVGVDGSASGRAAVDLAANEARSRRRPLRIIHALAPRCPEASFASARQVAEQVLVEAYTHAHTIMDGLPIEGDLIGGDRVTVLLDASRGADLLVLGDEGPGGFVRLPIRSVALQLASRADGPVLVARGPRAPDAPVLLGVDGSGAGDPAVGFAFEEAALRGVALVAVHAWTHPVPTVAGEPVEAAKTRMLADILAGWHDKYPDVVVRRQLAHGSAPRALIAASHRAQLAVVGGRGWVGSADSALGSVALLVLRHAACPVAVVPPAKRCA